MARIRWRWAVLAVLALAAGDFARGEEKLVLIDVVPRNLERFTVAEDGSKLYFAGPEYMVCDADGHLTDRIGVPQGSSPRDLLPLPDGWFVACDSYAQGHLALCRPDGTEARVLVRKGTAETQLRADMSGATSPNGAVVDAGRRLIFALDTTIAPRDVPDPDWSRIAVFDFDGKYLRDINRYDAHAPNPDDTKRTWYDDIALDTRRQRVYALARRTEELLAFDYDGKPLGRVKAPAFSGIAVFPDGRIAVGAGTTVRIFDPGLKLVRTLAPVRADIRNVETDGLGRLYASTADPGTTFLRWSPDLNEARSFGPRYLRLEVEFPTGPLMAGRQAVLKAKVSGRPEPKKSDSWQVLIRPADGSDLRWRSLAVTATPGQLMFQPPPEARGLYELAVRYGAGPIDLGNRADDPSLVQTIAIAPAGVAGSLAAITDSGRRAFRQGEPIRLQLIRRAARPATIRAKVKLKGPDGAVLATAEAPVGRQLAALVPSALTRGLPPGRYELSPSAEGHEGYALAFQIAPSEPDSPLQRILYHEFTQGATLRQEDLADTAERLAFVRDFARGVANLGFTRETDRRLEKLDRKSGPVGWRRDQGPVSPTVSGLPPSEFSAIPSGRSDWEAEAYLDQAVRFGLRYDSQLVPHCAGVRFRDYWLRELVPVLQRGVQWLGRYPSFQGVNYNDEMFFTGFNSEWTKEDDDWLQALQSGPFRGRPRADALDHALRVMYDRFNAAVHQAAPTARITTTPMWQFPAVDGSYAPNVYRGMDETYTHFLSEGYLLPWYPAHSAEFLRRPGLPLMGVFDNGHKGDGGDVYLKNLMQVAARGAQGVGVEHTRPFDDPSGADAYRTGNLLARLYGPIFAECSTWNAAAVLYSRTQDITETRNISGTPHWERVYSLVGAGLMAGVPMGITYEEDIAGGWLLKGKAPRVALLFLVGQKAGLPASVRARIAEFRAAGGLVFTDSDSAPFPGASKLVLHTHEIRPFLRYFAADTINPLSQPVFEALARELAAAVGAKRPFPVDTDDPWISKNLFDGGDVRYLMLASETGPCPWDAATAWSLGALYNKTYLPKTTRLTFPASPGVVYDVFERSLVKPVLTGKTARLDADLTTFPGRLFALAPARLGTPRVRAGVARDSLFYRVEIVDDSGKRLSARVPLRIRLTHGATVAHEIVRGTDAQGVCTASLALPATAPEWTLEIAELLGGATSATNVAHQGHLGDLLVGRPEVEGQRQDQVRELLRTAGGKMTLVTEHPKVLTAAQQRVLVDSLKKRKISLTIAASIPKEVAPGVLLVAGCVQGQYGQGDHPDDDPLWRAWKHGLFPDAVSEHVPGAGRGLMTAVFAPRGDREHAVVLLGGDAVGLDRAVAQFARWLEARPVESPAETPPTPEFSLTGKPAEEALIPRLRDRVGVKLDGLALADDGKHLVVSAQGHHRNLALIADLGARAEVLTATRIGQAPRVASLAIAPDGSWFGASGREATRVGQGFHRIDPRGGTPDIFAAFGDAGKLSNRFAISDRGDIVLAPGTHGVVCWRKGPGGWQEAWAVDYWKTFPKLDWPVSATAERLPQFQAVIPRKSDLALVLFGETTNNGWINPENPGAAALSGVRLSDGKPLWKFDVPIPKTLLFPELLTSPDGSKIVLRVQQGSQGKETYRYFTVVAGKAAGSWESKAEPVALAVADGSGWVASAGKGRLLELRRPNGSLVISRRWPDQPVSLAFAEGGQGVFVADDAGRLTRLDAEGKTLWRVAVGTVAALAARGDVLYAAGWDGRLRSYASDGRARWDLDCTPALRAAHPLPMVVASAEAGARTLHQAERPPTASAAVPDGPNLLRNGQATLTLGGTPGWMSEGTLQVRPEDLTNGRLDEMAAPWLDLNEQFWDATAGRQVWAEIILKTPADALALTVHEDPQKPDSWPTAAVVQVWNETLQTWETAARGDFLNAPANTYLIKSKGIRKLRYVPWDSYYRNFFTNEIELRSATLLRKG